MILPFYRDFLIICKLHYLLHFQQCAPHYVLLSGYNPHDEFFHFFLLFQKSGAFTLMVGGWGLTVYLIQYLWQNFVSIIKENQAVAIGI